MKKNNILVIMVDQLSGVFFPDGPADWLHAPNLKKLSERAARFQNAYTASPLCTPARASFMTGLLPSNNGVYDNAAELAAHLPTYAHHLRRNGYYTCLSGKMHFVGPDQLHGFEERLTTDIYPADFGWTPDYRKPGERIDWWYHNMSSVTDAGIAEITNQLEYDDEVANSSIQKLYQLSRGLDERPWSLTVSFTHPHDPYVARARFWDLYENCEYLTPEQSSLAFDEHDSHSQRILLANGYEKFDISEEQIKRARRAYFANISYLDEKVGQLLQTLKDTRQDENTAVIFVGDHGDMLGEKGLWFKMSFFDGSSRVPLMIAAPNLKAGLVKSPVSCCDLLTTITDLASIPESEILPKTDGESLLVLAKNDSKTTPVLMEYAAEASYAPMVSMRDGRWKYNFCKLDPEQLFDMESDPLEEVNLAEQPEHAERLKFFRENTQARWDIEKFDQAVRDSQACRWVVYDALRQGEYHSWEYQPIQHASKRYMRNHMDLNVLERNQRFPRDE